MIADEGSRPAPSVMPWSGTFISASRPSEEGDPAAYFRREFTVREGLKAATLHFTSLGVGVHFVNGHRVGMDVLSPGWTSYRHRVHVLEEDVTALLKPGANVVGAVVSEGWAAGRLTWESRRHNYTDRPATYLRLVLEYADWAEVVHSDSDFRVGAGAVRSAGIYAAEVYDAILEPVGWNEPCFDDADWVGASPFDWDLDTLTLSTAPPIRRIEELAPVAILEGPEGESIVDFGQIITGWVRITAEGDAGTEVLLRHAELLTPDGALQTETNRTAEATDRYVLAGRGSETWEPEHTFHGFRYVQMDSTAAVDLTAVVVHSEMTRTGWFKTSNPLVTQLHRNAVWSMRGNFVGVPTDCPQRDERLGWTGDLNAFAPTATFLYDVRGVLRSWLRDLADEQRTSGTVPWAVPDVLPNPSSPTALWSDAAISVPYALFQEYGDSGILRDAYPSMTALMTQIEDMLDDNALWSTGFQFGDWLDPDAPADNPAGGKSDRYLVAQAYLCKTTKELAYAADILSESGDAERYRALHRRVVDAFHSEYVTANGRVASKSVTAYALAIMYGELAPEQLTKAGERLSSLVEESGYTISTGFAGTPHVTDALTAAGYLGHAYKMLLQTQCPSFLYPVTQGATTIWERWDAVGEDGTLNSTGMTSLNHFALGSVADWLHRVVGGLQRLNPGWTAMRVAPQPGGGLMHASTAHETPLGRAEVEWKVEDGDVVLRILVPRGATAQVVLPLRVDGAVGTVGAGERWWRYPAPAGFGETKRLALQTPIKEVMENRAVWGALSVSLATYFPDIPLEAAGAYLGAAPLGTLADRVPENRDALLGELMAALQLQD